MRYFAHITYYLRSYFLISFENSNKTKQKQTWFSHTHSIQQQKTVANDVFALLPIICQIRYNFFGGLFIIFRVYFFFFPSVSSSNGQLTTQTQLSLHHNLFFDIMKSRLHLADFRLFVKLLLFFFCIFSFLNMKNMIHHLDWHSNNFTLNPLHQILLSFFFLLSICRY